MIKKSLKELADHVGGEVFGDEDLIVSGVSGIAEAGEGDITFIANPKYMEYLDKTEASAIIVSPEIEFDKKPLIKVDNPYLAFASVVTLMTEAARDLFGISEEAHVHPDAEIHPKTAVHPLAYIGKGAKVGEGTVIYPGVYIGAGAAVGNDSTLYPNVTLMDRCVIGDRVIIHSGTVIGSDGFGFAHGGTKRVKFPQVGIVRIDNDVEIGSNCSIDRASMGETWIKSNVIMDNLIQIGHNVVVDEGSIIIAQVGISGSAKIGKNVILSGQAGLVGHISIGDGVIVTAKTGIPKDIPAGQVVSGYPAMPHKKWLKAMGAVSKLPEMRKELERLKKEVDELKKGKRDAEG
ncbi:MAG: UDP-3-O-(3-hydroxymyristoyl)glucosamine N-acyltransferase [Deltaproteobacteria bacterium]|uniref:UDP-3-O-acylglucosamine N-acyltransferase n=1 Tax=Candidatus Zymogenus saltonus TaxID=2844893 RepID=A0A9D8PRQ7_9DELT|nr:UDP-3-O-(3-hydroxymyristoyl)glucosamine N-acyltransferase [Candidatus Zymogenus saltonus]